jgi:hypothetical protein
MADPDPVPAADSAEMYRVDNSELEAKFGDGSGSTLFTCLHTRFFYFGRATTQGCQMVCFQTKNPTLVKISRSSDRKIFIYFMAIWNIGWTYGIFYDHLVHFLFIWYIFPVLVSCTKKNPATLQPPDIILSDGWTIETKDICFKPTNCPTSHGVNIVQDNCILLLA